MTFTPEIERVLNDAVFLICALVALVSAGLVITRRNPVYATFMLLPMFISMAVLFVLLSAPFMAAMQVLVYGGAIVVVFLFVIMLLNLGPEDLLDEGGPGRWVVAGIVGALLFGLLAAPVVAAFTRDGALQAFPGQDKKPVAQFESETTAGQQQKGVAFDEGLKRGTLTLIIEHATEGADQIKLHDNGRGAFVLLDPDPRKGGALFLEDSSIDYSTGEWELNFSEFLPAEQKIQASIAPLPEAFGGIIATFGSTKAIGGAMFQNYLVPFELAGILLVVGIMGALLLSKERLRRLGDEVDADGTTEEESHV